MIDNTEINDIEQIQEEGTDTPIQEKTLNNEPEYVPEPNPWDNAPTDVYFYEKIYEDGHLGSFTQSAELAYKSGWDIENNYISIEDTQQSDVNGWTYRKELCPMKTEEDLLKDQYRLEITQLKKLLSDSDYKAIKFAEGQISEDEYSEIKSERQGYRDRINYLEGLL
ncbi:MAG: hypothetical protein VZR73_10685 [Acutalibacteraceae bacterium]|nr:hypothetical protein [Acutalibacteraceae bacterium]